MPAKAAFGWRTGVISPQRPQSSQSSDYSLIKIFSWRTPHLRGEFPSGREQNFRARNRGILEWTTAYIFPSLISGIKAFP